MDENNPLGLDFTTPINPLEALSGLAQNVQRNFSSGLQFINGAVRHVPTFLTEVRESFTPEQQPEQTEFDQKVAISPTNVGRIENQLSDTIASGIESTGDFLGVPRSISTPVAGAIGAIATPGVGDMKLAFGAGGATLTGVVSATNPRILNAVGVKRGAEMFDNTGAQGKQLINRTKNIEDYKLSISIKNDEMTTLRELRGDPKNLKTFIDNSSADLQKYWKSEKGDVDKIIYRLSEQKKTAQEALSQAQSNVLPFVSPKEAERIQDFKNVNYFRKKIGLEAKAAEQTARKIKGFLEQHHLFPKGMSAAYFGKMDELIEKGLATKDDLILMAEFAAVKGRRAGDIKANLLNMQRTPHNRMHTELRAMGAELNKTDYQRLLKDVDNVDDLLDRWADLFEPGIEGDAVYNAAVAELWEPMDELLKKISSDFTGTAKSKKVLNK
jgi:hypothetical protein